MVAGQCHFSVAEALPLVCVSTLFSFLCGVGIGGNDLSANFAMVVGSGSLNMKQAIIYCTVFEILGCVFMGAHVSGTIRNGIADPAVYGISAEATIIGMTAASVAASLWLFASAIWGLPVSITHTVVGSILGFAVFSQGSFQFVQYNGIVLVMVSWIAAPLLSAFAAAAFFGTLRKHVMKTRRPMKTAEAALPYCLATTLVIELVFVFIGRPPVLDSLAVYLPLRTAFLVGLCIIAAVCVYAKEFVFPKTVAETVLMEHFPWDAPTLMTTGAGSGGQSDDPSADDSSDSAPNSAQLKKTSSSKKNKKGEEDKADAPLSLDHTAYVQHIDYDPALMRRRSSIYRLSSLTATDSKLSTGPNQVKIVPVTKHHHKQQQHTDERRTSNKQQDDTRSNSSTGSGAPPTAPPVLVRRTTRCYMQPPGTPPFREPSINTVPTTACSTRSDEESVSPTDCVEERQNARMGAAAKNNKGTRAIDDAFGELTQSFPSTSAITREKLLQQAADSPPSAAAAAAAALGGYGHISPSSSTKAERRPPPLVIPKSPAVPHQATTSSSSVNNNNQKKLPLKKVTGAATTVATTDHRTAEEREMGVVVYDIDGGHEEQDELELAEGAESNQFHRQAEYLFTILQVVAGAASSFVHGAVAGANATAPFVILYQSFSEHMLKQSASLPSGWVSFPASLGIAVGMYSLGQKLMKTVGLELVTVTPVRGWSIQVGGTLITMLCTGIGIPVSLSQCQVGAAIGVGVVDGGMKQVAWRTVIKIIGGWLVTLFVAASTTGSFMWIMTRFYC